MTLPALLIGIASIAALVALWVYADELGDGNIERTERAAEEAGRWLAVMETRRVG